MQEFLDNVTIDINRKPAHPNFKFCKNLKSSMSKRHQIYITMLYASFI